MTSDAEKERRRERIRRALERFDFEDYIQANFPKVIPSGDHELRVDCFSPNGCAGSDLKAHLWCNISKKVFLCYRCGYGDNAIQPRSGSLLRFMADAEEVPIGIIINRLLDSDEALPEEEAFLQYVLQAFEGEDLEKLEKEPVTMVMPKQFHEMDGSRSVSVARFYKYAEQRGWPLSLITSANVHFCIGPIPTLEPKYQNSFKYRIIFPVYDQQGILRSVVARDVTNNSKRPRWVNWPNTDLAYFFWPLGLWLKGQWVSVQIPKAVALTESILGAYALSRFGTGAYPLACFGKKVSDHQIKFLKSEGVEKVILAWDLDAKDKMVQAAERLSASFETHVFPYRHPVWRRDELDLGDALLPDSPVQESIATEMETTIRYDSSEFLAWYAAA